MKRLRHVDVTMTLTSSGVVIRGLPGKGLLFYCQTVENMFADDKLIVHYIQKLRGTSATRAPASKRPNAVFL